MAQQTHQVSADAERKLRLLHAARTLHPEQGRASCIGHADLYGRLSVSLRPDPDDRHTAAEICRDCPLFDLCSVAVTSPAA